MKYFFLLLLLCPFYVVGQSINGVIVDAESKEPLPFVTISVAGSSYYVVSNEQGAFVLDAEQVLHKTIHVTNVYYEDYQKNITSNQSLTLALTPISYEMEQMLIYNVPIKKVFEEVIDHSEKSLITQAKLQTFYKEKYYEKGQYLKKADALVDFYIKNKTKSIDVVVPESRVQDSPLQQSKSDKEKENQLFLALSPDDMMQSAMRFKILRTIVKEKKYDCYITTQKSKDKEINTLYFQPIEGTTDEMLLKGKVVYDPEKKLILEFDLHFDEEAKKRNTFKNFIIARVRFNELQRLVKYNYAQGMYYLTYLNANYEVSVTSKLAKVDTNLASFSEIYVLGVEKTETFPGKDSLFKGSELYKAGTHFTTEYWKRPDIIHFINEK